MFNFLSTKFASIFSALQGQRNLTEPVIDTVLKDVTDALMASDVPYTVAHDFVGQVKKDLIGARLAKSLKPSEQIMKTVYDRLIQFLGGAQADSFSFDIPSVVMMMGLQGSGKTTSSAKIALYIKDLAQKRNKARKILMASIDFYRPAAIEQLATLALRIGVSFYRPESTDPLKACAQIQAYFKDNGYELLILDTAGRLHVDHEMIGQLKQVDAMLKPKYKILVLDSMMGQQSLDVATKFSAEVGFSGAVLTKMDSDTRGGCAFAFRYAVGKPILFVGTGEKMTDMEFFKPERIAGRMLDMGDLLTLAEKANERIEENQQKKMADSFARGTFSLQDFADQLSMVSKMGSLTNLMKYMPGMSTLSLTPDVIEKGEVELKKFRAIISSMTQKERVNPKVLNPSRKSRIAKGAGVLLGDIDSMLVKFEQSQQFVKMFKRMGKFPFMSS